MDFQFETESALREMLPSEFSSAMQDIHVFEVSGVGAIWHQALVGSIREEMNNVLVLGSQTGDVAKAEECVSIGRIEVLRSLLDSGLGLRAVLEATMAERLKETE